MPSATVPMWTLASSPSSRSARIFGSPVRNTSSGILRLVAKRGAGQRLLPPAAAELELELVLGAGEHDEAALGAGRPRSPNRAPAPARRRARGRCRARAGLRAAPRSAAGRRSPWSSALSCAGAAVGEQEHELGAAGAAQADAVAVRERALGDLLVVDVGAVAGLRSRISEPAAVERDFGVVARHFAAGQAKIVRFAAADAEKRTCQSGRPGGRARR